jgi:hypothetical protein
MATWRDEIRACPVCENRFAVRSVEACGSHGADSDFRPHFWGPTHGSTSCTHAVRAALPAPTRTSATA